MKKRILVAPLNWGLGHATRCIPIIKALINEGFEPILASDNEALRLLSKEFPDLICLQLPSYNIKYIKQARFLKWKFLLNAPRFLQTIKAERLKTDTLILDYNIKGIISDNRFGVHSNKVPSVYITHQVNILSGNTTWLTKNLHKKYIKKFNACWIPDYSTTETNLTGRLSKTDTKHLVLKFIGPLSRFKYKSIVPVYDLMVLLSGPEPQRTLLEQKIFKELSNFKGSVLVVKGIIDGQQTIEKKGVFTIYNYMLTKDLEKAIQGSKIIISRSGYTTIMDLEKLKKKAFFIPTPGQHEQMYLAKRLEKLNKVPFCKQNNFDLKQLDRLKNYAGLNLNEEKIDFKELFALFQSE
ncbi:glycosyltransferase [Lacinutrix salivirga]